MLLLLVLRKVLTMDVLALLLALGCPALGASMFAPHVDALAPQFGIPADVAAAVLVAESHCNPRARSRGGDVSAWQIRPGAATMGRHTYAEEQLRQPGLSTLLALRWMAEGRRKCGLLWLGFYATGKCVSTQYAKRIKAKLARAKR